MPVKITVAKHHGCRVVWQWSCIGWSRNISAYGSIFGLSVGDVNGCAVLNELEEFGGEVFMHPDTTMSAWAVFHPTSVKAVVGFEFTPVWHGGTFKAPARWLGA